MCVFFSDRALLLKYLTMCVVVDVMLDRAVLLVITPVAGVSLQLMSLVSRCMAMCLVQHWWKLRSVTAV